MTDTDFMDMAIEEARATIGRTSPNPPVGAVLVSRGEVLARGGTKPPGGPHAEIVALGRAKERSKGATLYVTLEPCCHQGRTGPCCRTIIDAGVSRVVVGCRDENPLVKGHGIETLEAAGIEVTVGVRGEVCEELAAPFFTWVARRRPYVVLKAAVTMDGRIATGSGDSRWITGEAARARVHAWRNRFDAVLVGAGTVRADDPALTTRLPEGGGRDPIRVVLDGGLETSPEARIYRQESGAPTWLVAQESCDAARLALFTSPAGVVRGKTRVEPLLLPGKGRGDAKAQGAPRGSAAQVPSHAGGREDAPAHGGTGCAGPKESRVDIASLLEELARREVVSLLVEGGAQVYGAFLASGLVDELRLFMAPKLFGSGPSWLSLEPEDAPTRASEALLLEQPRVEQVGEDLLLVTRSRHS